MSRQQVYAAAERGRYHRIDVRPLDGALGAEIHCGDLMHRTQIKGTRPFVDPQSPTRPTHPRSQGAGSFPA